MATDITTVKHLRAALRTASDIYIQPRFGTSEQWVKITKAEARMLIISLGDNDTPEYREMYSGIFGQLNGTALYLG